MSIKYIEPIEQLEKVIQEIDDSIQFHMEENHEYEIKIKANQLKIKNQRELRMRYDRALRAVKRVR